MYRGRIGGRVRVKLKGGARVEGEGEGIRDANAAVLRMAGDQKGSCGP